MATRIGTAPADRSGMNACASNACPGFFFVDDQDRLNTNEIEGMSGEPIVAIIGTFATTRQMGQLDLPEGSGVADHEAVVFVPERVLLDAATALLAQRMIEA